MNAAMVANTKLTRQATNHETHASHGGSGVSFSRQSLVVDFVVTPSLQLQIKHAMKNSAAIQNQKTGPTLFQAAAQIDDSAVAAHGKPATSLDKTPLADLMLHPEKVETVLTATQAADPATGQAPAKNVRRSAAPKKRADGGGGKPSRHSTAKTEFHLEAPQARSVKLAAEFTDWEKSPLDMSKAADGVWHAAIPLPPGDHSYRFIVDGQWCDDPHPAWCVPNPYGTFNAVVKVI